MGQPEVHWEFWSENPKGVADFYRKVFEWNIRAIPDLDYLLVETGGTGGINGGILNVPGYKPGAWVNYVNVQSLDQSVEKALKLGANVTKPKSPVPGMGWFAMLTDPQGNAFAMFQQDSQAK